MKLTDLEVSRMIPAQEADVFDVWMDEKSPGGPWFGADRTIMNPVVDGLFYFVVKHEARSWAHYGRFVRIDPPECVSYTWVSEATRGVESLVTVTFEARGEQTRVTLRHTGVPDDEMGKRHTEGWEWTLSKLEQRFATAGATKR